MPHVSLALGYHHDVCTLNPEARDSSETAESPANVTFRLALAKGVSLSFSGPSLYWQSIRPCTFFCLHVWKHAKPSPIWGEPPLGKSSVGDCPSVGRNAGLTEGD